MEGFLFTHKIISNMHLQHYLMNYVQLEESIQVDGNSITHHAMCTFIDKINKSNFVCPI